MSSTVCRRTAALTAALAVLVLLGVAATPALAHSFLATTRPAQGERLAGPPREVALQLSEPVEPDSAKVQVTDGQGQPVEVGRLEFDSGGAVVNVPLVSPDEGLYRVSWHVVSAVDGHESAGEFAFAVGDQAALDGVASNATAGRSTSVLVTAATWVLLAGWAVAFGAAVLGFRATGMAFPGRPRNWIRGGTLVALAGLAVRADAASGQRALVITLAAGLAMVVALVLTNARRAWPPLAALVAFAVVWPGRGHAAVTALGWVLDTVHLAAAGVWVGGLSVILVALATARRRGRLRDVVPLARVYAGTASAAVVTLLVTGVALGWTLLPSVGALVTDGYGRLVAVKTALLGAAITAAAVARRRLARPDADGVRRAVRPEHAALTIAMVVAALLVDTPPQPTTVETLLGPPPIGGPVARAAGLAGQVTIDVQAGAGRLDVNARKSSGGVDADMTVSAVLPDGTEVELHPRPCGVGCATLGLELPAGQTQLIVSAEAASRQGGTTSLSLHWPPAPENPALFDRMKDAMAAAERVEVAELEEAYPPVDAAGARMTGEQLVDLMPWAGGGVDDVQPVPGEPDRFTFYLPGSHMWFDVTVDDRGRLLTQRLVNPGHDIRYQFRYPTTSSAPTAPPQ